MNTKPDLNQQNNPNINKSIDNFIHRKNSHNLLGEKTSKEISEEKIKKKKILVFILNAIKF